MNLALTRSDGAGLGSAGHSGEASKHKPGYIQVPPLVTSSCANTSCIIKQWLRHNVEGALNYLLKSCDHVNRGSWAQLGLA